MSEKCKECERRARQLIAFEESYAPCEKHGPESWEGDGSCVICEGQALAAKLDEARALLAVRDRAFRLLERAHVQLVSEEHAKVERLRSALALAAMPLEALRMSECDESARALSPGMKMTIVAATNDVRAALAETEPKS